MMKYALNFEIEFKKNEFPGKFIVVEGIDGSGKTTQVHKIAEYLKKEKGESGVFLTKNPTDGPIGQFIRKVLSGEIELPSVSFQYLFSADRQVQQVEVLEHLKEGNIVISDRYFWSSIAYGIADRESSQFNGNARPQRLASKDLHGGWGELLLVSQSILSMYHQFIVPDFTFYLKISVDTALDRLAHMHKQKELYEKKGKLDKISAGYDWLIQKFPDEITVIDGEKEVEEVTKLIVSSIK